MPAPAPIQPPRARALVVLLALAAIVGVVVSLAAWGFLELIHQIQVFVFTDLPRDLGYHDGAPMWFYLVVLGLAGIVIALAITRLPGNGGHVPAEGLKVGGAPTEPIEVPGVVLAGLATIGLGLVLGPEAPLIALGMGLGLLAIRAIPRDTPVEAQGVIAASGAFAAMSMIFSSPIIAAVILIEALGLDRERLPLVLLPGLMAAGIGSLTSIGMGSITGLDTSAYSLGALPLPPFAEPALSDFAWTIPLALAVAVLSFLVMRLGLRAYETVKERPLLFLPTAGIIVAGLAIAFHEASGRGVERSSSPARIHFRASLHKPVRGRSPRSSCFSFLKGLPGVSGSAASGAVRRSRLSSSAPPPACSPRTFRLRARRSRRRRHGRRDRLGAPTAALGCGVGFGADEQGRRRSRAADHRRSGCRLPGDDRPDEGVQRGIDRQR